MGFFSSSPSKSSRYDVVMEMAQNLSDDKKTELVYGTIDFVTSGTTFLDLLPGPFGQFSSAVLGSLSSIVTILISNRGKDELVINPLLVAYPIKTVKPSASTTLPESSNIAPEKNPLTTAYLRNRKWKTSGGAGIGVIGSGLGTVIAVDVGGIATHGNASASTATHLVYLGILQRKYKGDSIINGWITAILIIKGAKLGIRGTQGVSSAIPTPVVSTVVSAIASAVAATAKMALTYGTAQNCMKVAAELHYYAQKEAGMGGIQEVGEKPATEILTELFKKRGATRLFFQYDLAGIIKEPAGWLAIGDKIRLV